MKYVFYLLLPLLVCCSLPTEPMDITLGVEKQKGLSAEQKKASSGNEYTIMPSGKTQMRFTITRPDQKDTSILLCIAGAFTRLDDGKVDGAYAVDGKIYNTELNHRLGGAIAIFIAGSEMFPYKLDPNAPMDVELQKRLINSNGSFFQQIQLIINGKAEKFKDDKLFQRRAICYMHDLKKPVEQSSTLAIIESRSAITLAAFTNDLVELSAFNALYTDMGDWDEGWYRNKEGKIVTIGTSRSQTARQSNWVVFTK